MVYENIIKVKLTNKVQIGRVINLRFTSYVVQKNQPDRQNKEKTSTNSDAYFSSSPSNLNEMDKLRFVNAGNLYIAT